MNADNDKTDTLLNKQKEIEDILLEVVQRAVGLMPGNFVDHGNLVWEIFNRGRLYEQKVNELSKIRRNCTEEEVKNCYRPDSYSSYSNPSTLLSGYDRNFVEVTYKKETKNAKDKEN